MKTCRMLLVGFGNVGKAFVELINRKRSTLQLEWGFDPVVTGIATGRHGNAIDPDGIPYDQLLEVIHTTGHFTSLSRTPAPENTIDLIKNCPADVLLENTPVNHKTGQPAIDHIRTGIERGMHAITANKGPVVHGFADLSTLATKHNVRYRFESAVMDGAPIFSLHDSCLPATNLIGFHGILNSCTNLLLTRMEGGESFQQAVEYAQSIGITETDPSADVDGWDAAIKVAALATVLMNIPIKPDDVNRQGIRDITPGMLSSALRENRRWKLVCRVKREPGKLQASVGPELVGPDSPLFSVNGTSSFIQFELDTLPGLGVLESDPGPETTAYGLLADLVNIFKREP